MISKVLLCCPASSCVFCMVPNDILRFPRISYDFLCFLTMSDDTRWCLVFSSASLWCPTISLNVTQLFLWCIMISYATLGLLMTPHDFLCFPMVLWYPMCCFLYFPPVSCDSHRCPTIYRDFQQFILWVPAIPPWQKFLLQIQNELGWPGGL